MEDNQRAAHLHLLQAGSLRWDERLALRDALRADPAVVKRCAQLKRPLATEHPTDREAYTAGKGDFVRRVVGEQSNSDQE